jgi:hypothetical protein
MRSLGCRGGVLRLHKLVACGGKTAVKNGFLIPDFNPPFGGLRLFRLPVHRRSRAGPSCSGFYRLACRLDWINTSNPTKPPSSMLI